MSDGLKLEDIAVGDQVRLISGGPTMTVQRVVTPEALFDGYVSCQWFAGKKLEAGDFQPESLVKISDDQKKT